MSLKVSNGSLRPIQFGMLIIHNAQTKELPLLEPGLTCDHGTFRSRNYKIHPENELKDIRTLILAGVPFIYSPTHPALVDANTHKQHDTPGLLEKLA